VFQGSATLTCQRPPVFPTLPTPMRFLVQSNQIWYGNIIMCGKSVLLGGSHAPVPRGKVSGSQFWDLLYVHAHSMKNSSEILHGDQTMCEEILIMTRDLFAVDNLVHHAVKHQSLTLRANFCEHVSNFYLKLEIKMKEKRKDYVIVQFVFLAIVQVALLYYLSHIAKMH